MENNQGQETQAQPTEKPRKQTFYAIVQVHAAPNEEQATQIIDAPNRSTLRKLVSENKSIAGVLAIFRGHRLSFETKKEISFH